MNTTAVTKPQGGTSVAAPERVEVGVLAMEEKFGAMLGTAIESKRFCRVAINAIQQTKDMDQVVATDIGRESVYTACLQAASDNLLLDKRRAALVVYNEKVKLPGGREEWVKVAKYMPMYQGMLELAHGSGVISKIVVQLVHAADTFKVMPTASGCPIHHEFPEDPFAARGEIKGGYAVAQFKDGAWSDAQVMTVDDINKIKARSKTSGSGPWVNDWAEMARKTLIRRLVKYLPRTIPGLERFDAAAHRVDDMYALEAPAGAAALTAPRKEMRAQQLLAPASPPAPPPIPPQQEVLPKEEAKKPATTQTQAKQPTTTKAHPSQPAKAAAKQAAREQKGPPPQDDSLAGFDERGGGGGPFVDPMTGETVADGDFVETEDEDDDPGV